MKKHIALIISFTTRCAEFAGEQIPSRNIPRNKRTNIEWFHSLRIKSSPQIAAESFNNVFI